MDFDWCNREASAAGELNLSPEFRSHGDCYFNSQRNDWWIGQRVDLIGVIAGPDEEDSPEFRGGARSDHSNEA